MEIKNFLKNFVIEDLFRKENLVSSDNGYHFKKDGHELVIKEGDDSFCIEYSYKEDPFMDYCERLDDDIFVKACEQYTQKVGPIKELDSNPTIENQTKFKNIVHDIVKSEIERLEKYL